MDLPVNSKQHDKPPMYTTRPKKIKDSNASSEGRLVGPDVDMSKREYFSVMPYYTKTYYSVFLMM